MNEWWKTDCDVLGERRLITVLYYSLPSRKKIRISVLQDTDHLTMFRQWFPVSFPSYTAKMIFIERDIQSIDQNRKSSLPNDLAVEGEVILKLNNYFSRYVHHYVSQNPVYLSLSLSKNSLFSLRIPAFRASPNFQTEVDSSKNGTRLGLSFSSRSVRPVKMYVYVRRRKRESENQRERSKGHGRLARSSCN